MDWSALIRRFRMTCWISPRFTRICGGSRYSRVITTPAFSNSRAISEIVSSISSGRSTSSRTFLNWLENRSRFLTTALAFSQFEMATLRDFSMCFCLPECCANCAIPRMPVSRLLNSWATPEASMPTAAILADWTSCDWIDFNRS
jgi:hypothetical protein